MKIAVFSARQYDQAFLNAANADVSHRLDFFEAALNENTVQLAQGYDAVCVFPNDDLNASVIQALATAQVKLIALRCSGYNNVDLQAAKAHGIQVVRVPAYSPYAVAEHTVALMLTLNRKLHHAFNRVREGNFELNGLMGFDMHGKTIGIIGTGRIGTVTAHILRGFGCHILAYDPTPNEVCKELGVSYIDLHRLLQQSDIITLHCPLTPQTHHLIDQKALKQMKTGIMLINTSRGAVIDTQAVIQGLKSGKIGYLGLDVYEEEADLFFQDLSSQVIQDDVFARLLTFPNVIITGHQAFFTKDALHNIAKTTLQNITLIEQGKPCGNLL
jgi:D-lactate dehydrogenase